MYFLCPTCKTSKYHTITYYFTLFDFYLEWSKHVNCTICKGSASLNLSLSKSVITWIPIFPLSLWQVTQLNITDFVKELALIIQKPLSLISFNKMSLPQCAALTWHYLTINSVTFDFFNIIIGCIYSSFNPDYLMCPSTVSMPLPSINGSMEYNALALLKLLSFSFSLPS